MFSEDFETDFGLKQNGELWGLQGVMREIVGNLLEKYWFLDSFGTDLVLETRTAVEMLILGRFSFI